MEAHAAPKHRTRGNQLPLNMAIAGGHLEVAQVLLRAMSDMLITAPICPFELVGVRGLIIEKSVKNDFLDFFIIWELGGRP